MQYLSIVSPLPPTPPSIVVAVNVVSSSRFAVRKVAWKYELPGMRSEGSSRR